MIAKIRMECFIVVGTEREPTSRSNFEDFALMIDEIQLVLLVFSKGRDAPMRF